MVASHNRRGHLHHGQASLATLLPYLFLFDLPCVVVVLRDLLVLVGACRSHQNANLVASLRHRACYHYRQHALPRLCSKLWAT